MSSCTKYNNKIIPLWLVHNACIDHNPWAGDSWHSSKIIRADEKMQDSSK